MNEKEREYFKIHAEGGMIDFEEPSTEEDEGGNNVDEDVSTIYESVRNRPQSTPKKSAKQSNKRQPSPVIEDSDSEIEFTAPAKKSPKTAKLANKETTPKKGRLYNARDDLLSESDITETPSAQGKSLKQAKKDYIANPVPSTSK